MISSLKNLTKTFIYPRGKVHKNYGKYVGWSCLSNVVISIESVLSTHSMLSLVGQTNSDLTLSINYIGKDIVGQLGGLWYMNKIGQKVDKESSKFINYSIFFQQSAVIMECATPLLPIDMFIPIAGIANIGEIYAKISILNTLGSTIGMAIGLVITARVPDHSMRLCLMPFFTAFRIYSYNKAVNELI